MFSINIMTSKQKAKSFLYHMGLNPENHQLFVYTDGTE